MSNNDYLQDFEFEDIEKLIDVVDNLPKPLNEFTVMFDEEQIYFNGLLYPLGTFSKVAFNFFVDEKLKTISPELNNLYDYYLKLNGGDFRLDRDTLLEIVSFLMIASNTFKSLIVFNDRIIHEEVLISVFEEYNNINHEEKFKTYLKGLIESYLQIADSIINFYEVFYSFSELIITRVSKEHDAEYLEAFDTYFNTELVTREMGSYKKFFNMPMLSVTSSLNRFDVVKLPGTNIKKLVEIVTFDDYSSLLQHDYFKALQIGNTVRICKNCKRAFLQLTEQDTIYCDRIYQDTNKTCRQVGPIRFHKEKVEKSPIHALYKKCYKKLYMRNYRNKANNPDQDPTDFDNIFNEHVSIVMDYKEQALNGKITIIELKQLYDEM